MLSILKGYKFLRTRNTLTFPLLLLNTWSVVRYEREESTNAVEVKELWLNSTGPYSFFKLIRSLNKHPCPRLHRWVGRKSPSNALALQGQYSKDTVKNRHTDMLLQQLQINIAVVFKWTNKHELLRQTEDLQFATHPNQTQTWDLPASAPKSWDYRHVSLQLAIIQLIFCSPNLFIGGSKVSLIFFEIIK